MVSLALSPLIPSFAFTLPIRLMPSSVSPSTVPSSVFDFFVLVSSFTPSWPSASR